MKRITNEFHMKPHVKRMTIRHWNGSTSELSSISATINFRKVPSKASGRKGTRKGWKRWQCKNSLWNFWYRAEKAA